MGKKSAGKTSRHLAQTAPSSFPQVRRTKDGQVQVTMTIPVPLATEVTSCPMTLIVSPEGLSKIESADRHKLGEELARQLFFAALALASQYQPLPAPLRRRRFDAMAKRVASLLAKSIHKFVNAQLSPPATQTPEFSRALQAIRETYNPTPRAVDVTAWLVEQYFWNQWGEIWDSAGLRRPTADPGRFARDYLYTAPHVSPDPDPDMLQGGADLVALIVRNLPS